MTRKEFLALLDDVCEQPPGTIKGRERLDDLDWDSLKVLSFIVMVDERLGIPNLSVAAIADCVAIDDLLAIVAEKISD